MLLNIQIDLLILRTYDGQFTLTTKKSLHIIFKRKSLSQMPLQACGVKNVLYYWPV